ncbi:MAG: aldo/keto reductase [Erysipelotrichaceae bacterium]|nr:aldo/keto reductase [Erysipelotrichaceae bacterium]
MEYRKIKKTDVSLLGFGCMRLPVNSEDKIDRAEAFRMLDYAYDHGVTYYDTAYPYHNGESELVLGEWLKTKDRKSVVVATKLPMWKVKTQKEFYDTFHEQLGKLQLDFVDNYLFHSLDKEKWELMKACDFASFAQDLKDRGLITNIGFSFHDDYEVFEEILKAYPWDFCQIQLNYMDTGYQAGIKGVELARTFGIKLVIMEPVKGGLLAEVPEDIHELFKAAHNWSDASWALRWVGSFDQVATILSGMSTYSQVEDNINTFDRFTPLEGDDYDIIDKAAKLFLARTQVPCTRCRYCMPCPFGVDIPGNFRVYNSAFIFGNKKRAQGSYGFLGDEKKASVCTACASCVSKCPQHINIPEELVKVKEYFHE